MAGKEERLSGNKGKDRRKAVKKVNKGAKKGRQRNEQSNLNPVDNNMWEILQEKMYKTRITDLDLLTTPLKNGCRNDDI